MTSKEFCSICDSLTGKAGAAEDSIYWLDGAVGPLCEECHDQLQEEVLDNVGISLDTADELARLRAIVEPLEALRDHECVTVAIVNDDPEANGERASGLYVSDTRIHWHCRPFYGPTLADALAKARAAQVEAEAKEEP